MTKPDPVPCWRPDGGSIGNRNPCNGPSSPKREPSPIAAVFTVATTFTCTTAGATRSTNEANDGKPRPVSPGGSVRPASAGPSAAIANAGCDAPFRQRWDVQVGAKVPSPKLAPLSAASNAIVRMVLINLLLWTPGQPHEAPRCLSTL